MSYDNICLNLDFMRFLRFLRSDSNSLSHESIKSHKIKVQTILLILFVALGNARAQFPAVCDSEKECVGNALTIGITSGKGAQYVDVDTSYRLYGIDTAITFEAWIDPQPQPGKIQYIAGLWGPNKDNNDQWVLYIQDTKIVFALSKDNSYKGDSDNTIAIVNVPDLYTNGWRHVAAVWDGQSTAARIYVDDVLLATATNPLYPIDHLHTPENPLLPLQIGSCNALYDDTLNRRAFLGQIDEIRLWRRALSQTEIACQRLVSLKGNEPELELYYRCNESPSGQTLCDATGHDHLGLLRSGAICDSSNRTIPLTYTVTPASVFARLVCTEDTDFTFSITDTSACGDKVDLGIVGLDAKLFSLSTKSLTLTQGVPQSVTVHLHSVIIGAFNASLAIANENSCGDPLNIPFNIQRVTELQYSTGRLTLDTIYVGCQNTTFSEATLTICNPGPRMVRFDSISTDSNHFLWAWNGSSFPKFLPPDSCVTITVRMDLLDSSKTLLDTLRIFSDESCAGSGLIPVYGRVQDVLGILKTDGKTPLRSMDFGEVCPGMISGTQSFEYRALGSDTVFVDSIVYNPPNFFGAGFVLPMKLLPKRANQPTYARFRPDRPGPFTGTLTVSASYHGCEIVKTVTLTGRGYSVDVDFLTPDILFGNVTIGKTAQQAAQIIDSGTDLRKMDSYLRMGDVFTITGGRSLTINPNQIDPITVQFRPRQPITYYDTLCIFDEGCYETKCIPVEGTGIFNAFSFDPPYLDLTNIVGCQSGEGTIAVTNISGGTLTVTGCTLTDPTGKFSLTNPMSPGPFANNQVYAFNVTYTPNDLANDRADEAYIDISLSDGEVYHVLLRATSVAPRLYVTPLTTYGIVEVGWQQSDSILIENASAVPEKITNITMPYGYHLLSANPALPVVLPPRDSLWLVVQFQPTGDSDYNANFTVQVDSPCTLSYAGMLTGTGQSVKLQVPISFMNYGLVKPCDCITREIPLPNYSNLVPITIDSIWIDGQGVTPLVASVFHWKRSSTGNETLPFSIAPQSSDTLLIAFCPDVPATKANLVINDTLHILAHSPGWSSPFTTLLSGRREMNFQPNITLVSFPATRVDTSAQPLTVSISVPDVTINPDGDSIVITSVTFAPDQRVFTAVASNGAPLPWILKRNQKFSIKVNFFPRAPKLYIARMQIHTTFPCDDVDTSILVMGSGFAPAFGLQMAFDTARIGSDTIRLTTCDTLVLPIESSRDIPQKYIDTYFHLGFDTSELELIGGTSLYTDSVFLSDTSNGANVILKNGVNMSAGPIATLKFKVTGGPKIFPITLDGINFDSDSLVFFKIIAGNDHGVVEIDQPMISISKLTDFDTVDVRNCGNEIITVYNPGVIPIRFDSLGGLPKWHTVTATSVPLPAVILPGDSVELTVTFCPRDEMQFDTTIFAYSSLPCPVIDSGELKSYGYAPPYPFKMEITPDVSSVDSLGGRIADTIDVPILLDRDIPLTPLDVRFALSYDPRALQYLSASSAYSIPSITDNIGTLDLTLPECQNLTMGEIARVKFAIAVPDSITSIMTLQPLIFTSDSIMWLKPTPVGDTSIVSVGPQCNITRLNFRTGSNSISEPRPNPAAGLVAIDVSFIEDASPELMLYNECGQRILTLMDGRSTYTGGSYHLEFDAQKLAAGAYYIQFKAAGFQATKHLMVIK